MDSEPRHADAVNANHDDNDDERIPGIVFHGSYGRYVNDVAPHPVDGEPVLKSTQTAHAIRSGTIGEVPTGPNAGDRRGLYAMDRSGKKTADGFVVEPGGTPCTGSYTTESSALNPSGGEYERMGYSARFVGDVNGDGCDDIAIGAQEFDELDYNTGEGVGSITFPGQLPTDYRIQPLNNGRVYLIFGQGAGNGMTPYSGAFDLAGGPKFNDAGAQVTDPSEYARPQLNRDANGDGTPDLQGVVFKASRVHSILGKEVSGLPAVDGESFNGDAVDDFVVGFASYDANLEDMFEFQGSTPACTDPEERESGYGAAAIIYGKALAAPPSAMNNWNLNPWKMDEYRIPSVLDARPGGLRSTLDPKGIYMVGGSRFGYLAYNGPAGDFNDDGYPDALIGHSRYRNAKGQAYILLSQGGSATPEFEDSPHSATPSAFFAQWDEETWVGAGSNPYIGKNYWITLRMGTATTRDFTQPADADGSTPWDVGSAEELVYSGEIPGYDAPLSNGNMLGAPNGVDNAGDEEFARPNPFYYTRIGSEGDFGWDLGMDAGWSVWTAGDVDNDGWDDILVGAPAESNGFLPGDATAPWMPRGRAYLVHGFTPGSSDYDLDLDALADTPSTPRVAIFRGEHNGDQAGWAVTNAGDVDADGYDDFLVSAPWADHPDTHGNHNADTPICWGGSSGDDVPGHHVIFDAIDDTPGVSSGWVDVDCNEVWTPSIDHRGYVGDNQVAGKGFHKNLGAVYLIYGKQGGFQGHLELSDVGDPDTGAPIRGYSLWGMTGRGADIFDASTMACEPFMNDNNTPSDPSDDYLDHISHVKRFKAPEFGHSVTGNVDLNDDGRPDFVIGVPRMAKPRMFQYFPADTGGVVAVFDGSCLQQAGQLVNAPGGMLELAEQLRRGTVPDLNSDGLGDVNDLLEALGALGGSE